jgi:hypothetical protein
MFPADYRASRNAFFDACRQAGGKMESHEHPLRGADGDVVATDVASFGAASASQVLMIVCGTHGVEGLCGSGMQLGLLQRGFCNRIPPQARIVFVHALNPHGFLELRRTNEDNVDLNRNFIDHSCAYPDDAAYAEVHPMLVPADWDGSARREADARIEEFVRIRGASALQAAISRGQYTFSDGLFYGGRAPSWSNGLWRRLLQKYAAQAQSLAVVDFHSGLGRRGACELISGATANSQEQRLANTWFGDGIVFPGLTSTAPAAAGYMGSSLVETLPEVASALVVAEIGTVSFDQILLALRADNWLHARGQRSSKQWRKIKALMEESFVGRDRPWQDEVVEHAARVCGRALAGLLT